MPTTDKLVKCKQCGLELPWGTLRKHHIEMHGLVVRPRQAKAMGSVSDRFDSIQKQIKDMVNEIDVERNLIQRRLLELDALAAKYAKLV